MLPKTIKIHNKQVFLIDQRLIPEKLELLEIKSIQEMYEAIKTMVVRGAPAIGVSAAAGMALYIESLNNLDFSQIEKMGDYLIESRPTAVNLSWAVKKVLEFSKPYTNLSDLKSAVWNLSEQMAIEDEEINREIGRNGAEAIIKYFDSTQKIKDRQLKKFNILTHCNAGSLATVYWGTALGVVRELHNQGRLNMVYADETRPRLQGGKITAWELKEDNIPVTVITDNMAAWLMKQGKIDLAVVGADRIASNGDAANKIGTYSAAINAKYHKIPFYVAAPVSTIDFSITSGDEIVIEERDYEEVTHASGVRIISDGVEIINPAFDVTPLDLITGIITEKTVVTEDFSDNFALFGGPICFRSLLQ